MTAIEGATVCGEGRLRGQEQVREAGGWGQS